MQIRHLKHSIRQTIDCTSVFLLCFNNIRHFEPAEVKKTDLAEEFLFRFRQIRHSAR